MSDVFEVLKQKCEEEIVVVTDALTKGSPENYATYQHLCGQIRGLRLAQQKIKDLSRAYKEDDDEE